MNYITDTLNNENIKPITNGLYIIIHLIVAIVLVILLSSMLGFIIYTTETNIPYYTFLLIGLLIWITDTIINHNFSNKNDLQNIMPNINNTQIYDSLWKIPYYGIIGHYIFIILEKIQK